MAALPSPPGCTVAGPLPASRLGLLGDSFILACPSMKLSVERHSVTLACAVGNAPLTVTVGHRQWTGRLLAVQPSCARCIDSAGQPAAVIDLEPTCLRFNTFSRPPGPQPVQVLDDQRFAGLLACARAFAMQALCGRQLQAALHMHVAHIADSIAPHRPLHRTVLRMMAALRLDPGTPVPALAAEVGLSPSGASRLFAESLGISIRQYALFVKIQHAAVFIGSGRPLTRIAHAAGFTDSSHLAKVWMRCYGARPSHYFSEHRHGGWVEHVWRRQVSLGQGE